MKKGRREGEWRVIVMEQEGSGGKGEWRVMGMEGERRKRMKVR